MVKKYFERLDKKHTPGPILSDFFRNGERGCGHNSGEIPTRA